MKRWMKIALVVVALLVVVLVAIPFLVNANTFRPLLETQLTTALGRQVKLGNLSLSLFSGSLVANDLAIADDPAYSATPFLTAKQVRIGVEMKPLIFDRQLKVRSFEIVAPQVHLVQGEHGSWNFSSIGKNAANQTGSAQQALIFPDLTVGLVAIQNGRAVVESLPADGPPRMYENLNLSVRQFSFAKRFPFTLSASLPADGAVTMTGNAGPINQQDAAMTAFDTQMSVKHLDPVAAGFLDPNVGVSMLADIDAHATSSDGVVNSSGTIHMQRLQLRKGASPTPRPVDLVYSTTHNLRENSGQVQDAAVHTGSVAVHLNGTYQLQQAQDPLLNLKLTGQSLPIDELQALMTAAGVKLPNGSVLKGGTLTIAFAITGPAKNLVITGPIDVENTHLVGFDLGSKISGIAALGGIKTGDTTSIQTLRLNMQAANAGLTTDHIYALMPAVGEATGSGTVSPAGALNYRLIVKVTTAQGIGKAGVGLLTKLNSLAGSAAKATAASGVPMLVTGTATDPIITADVKGLVQRNASTLFGQTKKANPMGAIKGLFGKKN
ncbi:MAG TPA: AsmA family protein [Acidobacteriaceae bacterium]|nr:AsmA family protein [Acidobacteriaceae bacterium]